MNPSPLSDPMTHCHEFVRFSFTAGTDLELQRSHMAAIDEFARRQPGFVARHCYHDASGGVWIDHVTWINPSAARAAFERAGDEPTIASAFAAMDQTSLAFGHFELVAAS